MKFILCKTFIIINNNNNFMLQCNVLTFAAVVATDLALFKAIIRISQRDSTVTITAATENTIHISKIRFRQYLQYGVEAPIYYTKKYFTLTRKLQI